MTLPMAANATYLYCLVHAATVPAVAKGLTGIPGAGPLAVLPAAKSLWVVTSEVPLDTYGPEALERGLPDLQWVAQVALAHEEVVEGFARVRTSTAVPMKLFTMFTSPERAIAETRARRREVAAVVKRIGGCEEWGVRITRRPARASRVLARAPLTGSGAAFLTAKKHARDAAREELFAATDEAEAAHESLAAIARDARRRDDVPDGAASPPVLDAAFLVPVERRARFKATAKRLAGGAGKRGLDLTVSGPWPAYNFVEPGSRG